MKTSFKNFRNALSKEDMKKITGGYGGEPDAWTCYCSWGTNQELGWSMQYYDLGMIYDNCGSGMGGCTPVYI